MPTADPELRRHIQRMEDQTGLPAGVVADEALHRVAACYRETQPGAPLPAVLVETQARRALADRLIEWAADRYASDRTFANRLAVAGGRKMLAEAMTDWITDHLAADAADAPV